jgi:hypothetical protein
MSTNAALADLRLPAAPARENKIIALLRRPAAHPRWAPERPNLDVGYSYRIPDGRSAHRDGSNWVHTHH